MVSSAVGVILRAPWTPARLPGLVLWLDAGRITGLVDGDPVATWSDLSGLGNHATQATASKRPTYKVNIVNGRPVVRFDGVDDVLGGALTGFGAVSDSMTMIAVVKLSVNQNGAMLDTSDTVATTSRGVLLFHDAGGGGTTAVRASSGNSAAYVDANTTAFAIHTGVHSPATRTIYRNGAAQNTNNTTQNMAAVPVFYRVGGLMGDVYPLAGDVAEALICFGALTTAQQKAAERFLGVKYALAVA